MFVNKKNLLILFIVFLFSKFSTLVNAGDVVENYLVLMNQRVDVERIELEHYLKDVIEGEKKGVIYFYHIQSEFCNFNLYLKSKTEKKNYTLEIDGKNFYSMEHYLHYSKVMLVINDTTGKFTEEQKIVAKYLADKIENPRDKDPEIAKKIGGIAPYAGKIWREKRGEILLKGLRAKFTQFEDYKKALLSTENKIIIEHAKSDRIWGDGYLKKGIKLPTYEDPEVTDYKELKEPNLLGKALMIIRDELK